MRIYVKEHLLCIRGSEYTKCTLLDMTKKVVKNLAEKNQQVQEGVAKIMGGRVWDYEAKDILRTGIQEGMKQGRQQGETAGVLKILVDLVHKGILSAADAAAEAAEKVDVTEDEFKKLL